MPSVSTHAHGSGIQAHLASSLGSPKAGAWSLALAIVLYLFVTAFMSSRRLWHDELFTLYIATAHGWTRFRHALALDLNPPLEYFAVRASAGILGNTPYAVRLPSIIAFLAGTLCIWRFVAKRFSAAYGLLAVAVIWASPFFYYATEARPYALITGFLGAALLVWQRTCERKASLGTTFALAAVISGMMLTHLMSVLYIAPFCLAEIALWRQRRSWRVGVWAALLVPCSIPFIYEHMLARVGGTAVPPAFQASLRKIAESYYGSLRLEALPLLIALILALVLTRKHSAEPAEQWKGTTSTDWALIIGFASIPALVNFTLIKMHGAYFDRYALPVVFGYALAIAFFLARQTNVKQQAAWIASGVLLLFTCAINLGPHLKQSVWARRDAITTSKQIWQQVRPDLPLVAASGLTFLEMDYYESPQTVGRLYYVTDRALALQYASATMFDSIGALKEYFPIRAQIVPFDQFTTAHRTFLVLGTPDYPEDWLLRALLATPANVRFLGDFPSAYKDSQLYLVTLP